MSTPLKRKHEAVAMADSTENNEVNRPAKQWKATIPLLGERSSDSKGSDHPEEQQNNMQLNRPPQQWKVTVSFRNTRRTDGKDTNDPEEKRNDARGNRTVATLQRQEKKDSTSVWTAAEGNIAMETQDDTFAKDEDKESTGSESFITGADSTTDEERNPEDVTTPPFEVSYPGPQEQEQSQDQDGVWIPTMFMSEADKENLGPYMKAGIITIRPPMVHSYTVKLGDDIHQQYHIHPRVHEAFHGWWMRVASHLAARQCNKRGRPQAFLHERRKFYFFKWPAIIFKMNDSEDKEKLVGFGLERFQNLNLHHIHALVRTLCHPSVKETMHNNPKLNELILWVRFGLMSPPDEAMNTDLDQFAYLDQASRAAPSKMSRWAKMMGATLAILHWKCNFDAQGVNFKIGRISRYCVGLILENPKHVQSFDPEALCAHSLAQQIVSNPTWPRPVSAFLPYRAQRTRLIHDVWESFSDAYLSASKRLLSECESEHIQGLPESVLWSVCQLRVISPMYLDDICHEILHKRLR